MALKIYELDDSTASFAEISVGLWTNSVAFNVKPGGSAVVHKLYLRNDDVTKWYNGLTLKPTGVDGSDIVDGSVTIKLVSGDATPTDNDWSAAGVNSASTLTSPVGGVPNRNFPEIGSAGNADLKYYPFWVQVSTTKASPIGTANFSLELTYTENVV